MLTDTPKQSSRKQRWWNLLLYSIMVLIVMGLLLLLHLVSVIQNSNHDPVKRRAMANRIVAFNSPQGYRLTSAVYAIHPRFFVLTREDNGQKIRVVQQRWWSRNRTPAQFRKRFDHPGQWVKKPGLGYDSILVEQFEQLESDGFSIPYLIGVLSSSQDSAERGYLACLHNPDTDESLLVFSSAPSETFNATEALDFTRDLAKEIGH